MKALLIAAAAVTFSMPALADDGGAHAFLMREGSGVIAPVASRLKTKHALNSTGGHTVRSSWYGGGEKLSKHNANGTPFNPRALTVAHRTLPFGTRVLLTYGGQQVVATVADRGPAEWTGRSLDVSRRVAEVLGFKAQGVANIKMAVLR